MGGILFQSLLAALNPTLVAATTVMLLLPHPERLMLGYWLGAISMSVTLGLVIVFALEGSSVVNTSKNTLSPATDFVLATLMLILAGVLAHGGNKRVEEGRRRHRANHQEQKEAPKWQRRLGRGTARTTFVVGALLSLPGAIYLVALKDLTRLKYATTVTVLVVIVINLIQLLFIEIPIVALKVAPTQTPILIEHAKEWGRLHGREYGARGLVVLGVLLTIRGLVEVM
jgi:hypothetical protein